MRIGKKLILGFLIVIIIMGVSGYIAINSSENKIESAISESTVNANKDLLKIIGQEINLRVEKFVIQVQNTRIRQALIESNKEFEILENRNEIISRIDTQWSTANNEFANNITNNDISVEFKRIIDYLESKDDEKVYGEAFLTNKYGVNIAQSQKTSDYLQSDESWWERGRAEGHYMTEVEYDESAQIYSTDYIIRVDDDLGNFIGILKVVLNLEGIINSIDEVKENSRYTTTEFVLIDEKSRIIYATNNYRLFEKYRLLEDIEEENGVFIDFSKSGKEELFAFAKSTDIEEFNGLGWTLISHTETAEILDPVRSLQRNITLIFAILTVVSIGISIYISNSITKPIHNLTLIIESISKGKLDVEIDEELKKKNDETGKLARAFDRTIISLKMAMKKDE